MNDKEIVLSKIAEIISRPCFFIRKNSEFKARLKCVGLNDLYEKYVDYLVPYWYKQGHSQKFENNNDEYDVFMGLDSIFSDLYKENRHEDIINLLKEITKSFNVGYISEDSDEDFEELAKLYEILGLSIAIEFDKVKVSACMESDFARVSEMFSVESWIKSNHKEVYDAYKSALDTIEESDEIIADGSDKDLVDLAKMEKLEAQDKIPAFEEELKVLLIPVKYLKIFRNGLKGERAARSRPYHTTIISISAHIAYKFTSVMPRQLIASTIFLVIGFLHFQNAGKHTCLRLLLI